MTITPTPRIGPRQVVYENQYQQIYRVTVQFDGFQKEFFVNDYGQRTGLVIAREDEVLLVRQYRLLVNAVAWEIPGGRVDAGETPEAAAIREGLEEACLHCRNLKRLLYFHPGLDTFHNPTHLFYTRDFAPAPREHLHAHEVSDQVWVPLGRCLEMIFAQQIVDSLTIAALFAFRLLLDYPELSSAP
jgi:8-oxo-dGTP pyrophosphatase MutT (NUDIX family)